MKPGLYYIGDPSYIVKGEDGYQWIEKLWKEFYQINSMYQFLIIDGVELFLGRTYGGDGIYDDFFVDSGTISVILINKLLSDSRFNFRNMNIRGTKFITFNSDFSITYENGIFNIGGLIINTYF